MMKRLKMVSFRASDDEIARIKLLTAELQKKHPYVKEADVLRELVGLIDTGIITIDMRKKLSSTLNPKAEFTKQEVEAQLSSKSISIIDDVDLKVGDAREIKKGQG